MTQKELTPSTYKQYCRMLETRLLPYFGYFYINKIKPTDIMKFYDLLEKDTQLVRKSGNDSAKTRKPLSGKTILEHHRLLKIMLHKAVYWQLKYQILLSVFKHLRLENLKEDLMMISKLKYFLKI